MKRIVLIIIAALLIGGGFFAFQKYQAFWLPNVPNDLTEAVVEIPTGSNFADVVDLLHKNGMVKDTATFIEVANRLSYVKNPMRAGRYKIKESWNNLSLVRHLRGGKQETVKVVLSTARMSEEVAGKVAEILEFDSLTLQTLWQDDKYLKEIGYSRETLMSLFIPNTYDFFWNTSPKKFTARMIKEHDKFWAKKGRKEKAKAMKRSPEEVYALASIVEKETNKISERPRMAGVYLNRLRIGMPLQADPTSVFATRDFTTKRVTDYHTTYDSPYNTYMYRGLPPGPIAMSSIASIDGVLNSEDHKFLYFCAVGDGSGTHNFAKTLTQHNQNAAIYRGNLKKRGRR
ncbi:MAG: UPF0755 protein [Saprospiraceae bacterium]|jgi:UPF0755 protein